ncbi:MAG TPA: sigma-70 region 4 domain-containing protein [Solirubrobacteraceae bacterium]|nr:sigma-70 region 4 domain-containing protein [Solirubrobacteraceae bacterium]
MARIDELRPDQRAALQLLLQQSRSYEDIASLLRIEPSAVRERAHAALDALGPEDVPGLTLADQDEIGDYLLGQQSASQRAGTRDFLETSAAGRAWARAVAGELRTLAGDNLPEIPAEAAEVDEAFDALEARTVHRDKVERSSRVGGAILIAAAVIALFGLVALAISVLGGDDDDGESSRAGTTTTSTQEARPRVIAQINLLPPEVGSEKLNGVAQIAQQDQTRAVALVAEGFAPARDSPPRFYAIWIYKSQDKARRLGFPPQPDKQGRIATSFPYPKDAKDFDRLIITQESEEQPRQPGRILLSGPLEGTPVTGEQGQPPTQTAP